MAICLTDPKIVVGNPPSIAEFRFWEWPQGTMMWKPRIILGNWSYPDIPEPYKSLSDDQLTVLALNEEYMHLILARRVSVEACDAWDNFTRDLRCFLQWQS